MFRDLLVHVDGGAAGRGRVQFAFELAARTDARVTELHVTPPVEVSPRYKPSLVAEVADNISSKLFQDARAAAATFKDEATRHGADLRWFEMEDDLVEGITDHARYADVVILGQYERQGSPEIHPLPVAHSVVSRCGRPVLIVPAAAQSCALTRVAVAWDGGREAVRAVHDALPLLRLAQSVQIVTVVSPSDADSEADAERLSIHLANHGIARRSGILQIRSAEEHDSLRLQIEQGDYDLLVMGAYSHPMWQQFIFGGTTQSILLSSKIPILISH